MQSIPVEWNLFGVGDWNYATNKDFIYNFWINGTRRAKPYEGIFTIGMRGAGEFCIFYGTYEVLTIYL